MNELTLIPPQELMRQATDIAGLCKAMAIKTKVRIGNKDYIPVETWQAIATAHGCVASARDVERIEGGFRAIGEVRRISDGIVLSTAEGFVGDDEPQWFKRPEYAKRAMAQTRSLSRACRSAFAYIVILMDAGLSTTPLEEVPDGGFDHAPENSRDTKPPIERWQDYTLRSGKNEGKRLGELEESSLNWYRLHYKQAEARQWLDKSIEENYDDAVLRAAFLNGLKEWAKESKLDADLINEFEKVAGYGELDKATCEQLHYVWTRREKLLAAAKEAQVKA